MAFEQNDKVEGPSYKDEMVYARQALMKEDWGEVLDCLNEFGKKAEGLSADEKEDYLDQLGHIEIAIDAAEDVDKPAREWKKIVSKAVGGEAPPEDDTAMRDMLKKAIESAREKL